ncbi:MAG: bifunctional diaminohydroxyphosphoribosylaminopyrimidine deaminase/5-amino-6-(5-phosphoribosylamino)uracil reductase RibD [bacterium]|nr:bifunctional diaminohydroxyphosphoribosylaminopyrimidine deaminase/5-amino-6-(5-phosphoribosylamino)uracil reductase RibD [bacterium]
MSSTQVTDEAYMQLALELAQKGRSTVRSGAMVGAVAVRGGQIIGEGFHPEPGKPHAEVYALEQVADGTPDVTLYVTLEPCAHTGRTPPCADFLIRKKVSRVVCAMVDPDVRVSGQGIGRLREAGIAVEVGLLEAEARRLNEVFIKHRTTGLPFVTLKLAQTLDGCIATASGDSKWITSEASRTRVHEMRAAVGAVLVGSGTVRADDPRLSVRLAQGQDPVKIVLDSRLEVPTTAQVFQGARLVLAALEDVPGAQRQIVEDVGAEVWTFSAPGGRPALRDVLARAGKEELTHVFIEGGGEVAASALREGLGDRVAGFIAPKLVGGGISAVGEMGILKIADAVQLEDVQVEQIGDDLLYTAKVKAGTGKTE